MEKVIARERGKNIQTHRPECLAKSLQVCDPFVVDLQEKLDSE